MAAHARAAEEAAKTAKASSDGLFRWSATHSACCLIAALQLVAPVSDSNTHAPMLCCFVLVLRLCRDREKEMGMRAVKGAAALKKEISSAFTLSDNFAPASS